MSKGAEIPSSNIHLLSDDDFETEARLDASRYAMAQKADTERERIKAENKVSRKQGLPVRVVPRRIKRPSAADPLDTNTSESSEDSDDLPSSGFRKRKRKTKLIYEGRASFACFLSSSASPRKVTLTAAETLLDHNPLHRLAGLRPNDHKQNRLMRAKEHVVSHLGTTSSMSMPPSAHDVPPQLYCSTQANAVAPSSKTRSPSQHEEVDFEDEDDTVLVPWGRIIGSGRLQDPQSYSKNDEEGIYSEDEDVTAPCAINSSQARSQTSGIEVDNTLPPFRPFFSPEAVQQSDALPIDEGVAIPASINRHLRPYQREGVKFLYNKYRSGIGGVLGDDMGSVGPEIIIKVLSLISQTRQDHPGHLLCALIDARPSSQQLAAVMRKSGTKDDYQRRKRTVRSADIPFSPKHWPTALVVCPKSLMNNVGQRWILSLILSVGARIGHSRLLHCTDTPDTSVGIFRGGGAQNRHTVRNKKSFQSRLFGHWWVRCERIDLTTSTVLATYDSVRSLIDDIKGLPIS